MKMGVTLKIIGILVGAWVVGGTTDPCQSKISTNGYGQIQSPDFPAVKSAYTCRNFFYYPQPKGAVVINVTDISLYYFKDKEKVCAGELEIGTYKAPCLKGEPFCIVYFNDMKCIQPVVLKYRDCLWHRNDGRSVDTMIKSDGQVGQGDTDNSTLTSSWSYPQGVRMTYEFIDCPQDPTATASKPVTPRTTLIPGAIIERTDPVLSTTIPIFPTWMVSNALQGTANATVPSQDDETTGTKVPFKSAQSLTFPEIIVLAVVLFVVVVVLTIAIILIIVKAQRRKKSWTARLPSVLTRDYRISGEVPPSARTAA